MDGGWTVSSAAAAAAVVAAVFAAAAAAVPAVAVRKQEDEDDDDPEPAVVAGIAEHSVLPFLRAKDEIAAAALRAVERRRVLSVPYYDRMAFRVTRGEKDSKECAHVGKNAESEYRL